MHTKPQSVNDAQSDPEPAAPSLAEPDPGIFQPPPEPEKPPSQGPKTKP